MALSKLNRLAIALIVAAGLIAGMMTYLVSRAPAFTVERDAERNVLLVTIDTLRADALASYGGRAATPNLDGLASRGARFTFAHAHAVVTLPSHASILSGRYPYEHGIRDNTGYRFDPASPTVATLLKSAGFATGAFVGGFPLDRRFGLGTGFDTYDDTLEAGPLTDPGERERRADAVVASATKWIGGQQGKWLAWVHLYDPHTTYSAPAEWAARYPDAPYLGEVAWTDFALGPLLTLLENQPRNTLVIVTADHGESLGEHGETTHGVFAYESTLRVPLIIAQLGGGAERARTPQGLVIDTPVRHVDLLPTILDAAAVQPKSSVSGASLTDVIARGAGDDRPSYFEAMTPAVTRGWAPLRGLISGRQKYIDLPLRELYDLAGDPREAANLITVQPGRAEVLLNLLKGFDVAPPSRAAAETPETIERLRSLGYIGGGTAAVRERYTDEDDPKRLIEIEQMLERATQAHRAGRPDEAAGVYRAVIERRKDTEDAYRKLALIHWQQGRAAEAVSTLELALANGVTQSEVRIKLGQYLAESGQPGRAIELLSATAGDDPDGLTTLGNAYVMANRPRDAIATFDRLLRVDPENAIAFEGLGAAQLQTRNFAAAESALRRSIALDSTRAVAHTSLGVALASTGRRGEAIESWKRAIALDAADLNALFNVTINLVEAGRRDEAATYAQRFISTAPPEMQADVATLRRLLGGK